MIDVIKNVKMFELILKEFFLGFWVQFGQEMMFLHFFNDFFLIKKKNYEGAFFSFCFFHYNLI